MSSDPTKAIEVYEYICSLPDNVSQFILQDLERWLEITGKEDFCGLWSTRQEFRSLVRYRMSMSEKKFLQGGVVNGLSKIIDGKQWLYVTNLYIQSHDIGPGFYIEHGFSTIILAKKIGKNFWVNQNVTIGNGPQGSPVIGDNVSVRANAVVFGGFPVANNVVVGAGAVLNKAVPEGSVVVSQPCRIL